MRVWDMGGSSTKDLDYSERNGDGSTNGGEQNPEAQTEVCTSLPSTIHIKSFPVTEMCILVAYHSEIKNFKKVLNVLALFQGIQLRSMEGDLLPVDYESSEEEDTEEQEEKVVVGKTRSESVFG